MSIKDLVKIDFFKDGMHPEYKPFVGSKYENAKIRVLHVGESHYFPNKIKNGNASVSLSDCSDWFEGIDEMENQTIKEWKTHYCTREVIDRYMKSRLQGYQIFTNFIRAYLNGLDRGGLPIEEAAKCYEEIAFMNFYQMPALYEGVNFTKSLQKGGDEENDWEMWYKCMKKSSEIFEAVVKALEPNLIVITSKEVGKYYERYGNETQDGPGKLIGDKRLLVLPHSGCSWWNRPGKNGELPCKELEERIRKLNN